MALLAVRITRRADARRTAAANPARGRGPSDRRSSDRIRFAESLAAL
jgi:hypothetical protein